MRQRRWKAGRRIDLRAQLGPLRRGSGDPTWASVPGGAVWRTTLTPDGPGLELITVDSSAGEVVQSVWGPGGNWLADRLPVLFGADDLTADEFAAPAVLEPTVRRYSGWRAGRTHRVTEALIAAILEQKVTGKEAWLGWRTLVAEFGEPPPGPQAAPAKLRVFPPVEVWRQIPSWKWHAAAVDVSRSTTILRALDVGSHLDGIVADPAGPIDQYGARQLLRSVRGVGIWTTAETAQRALGDTDAVSYRDYHLAQEVVYALTGKRDGTDEDMARLLLPYAGHRFRIQRFVELSDIRRPRRGPKLTIYDMRDR